ncbi:MAG: helix-turn-helix domain-containing protein [Bacteroidia bacterium]|jgi:transcriptional regulator with XRE-family HTH domain|nr:helix-turn-helix domain-containing protein [Bacteroidia bacterium]
MFLSDRIRKIRVAKMLTQEQVAQKCGISSSAYGQIERNAQHSSYDTLKRVAEALSVSLLFLIDTENDKTVD